MLTTHMYVIDMLTTYIVVTQCDMLTTYYHYKTARYRLRNNEHFNYLSTLTIQVFPEVFLRMVAPGRDFVVAPFFVPKIGEDQC